VSVFLADEQSEELDLAGMRNLADLIISTEGYPKETEVTLLFVDEDEMSSYNERFLNRTGPTDVLAFPVEDLLPGVAPDPDPTGPPLMIGDVIIAPAYVKRQAIEFEVSFDDEMALMVTHGILHLMGYDHQADGDASAMEGRESEILALVGRKRR
jgi:probable rRNA maturation factor